MVTKRIICLANSRKRGAHCVAGIEVLQSGAFGGWVRPIGSGPEDALLEREQCYTNGTSPKVLDVLDIQLAGHKPSGCQTENWLVNGVQNWVKVAEVDPAYLVGRFQSPATLFENGRDTYAGINDEVLNVVANGRPGSLLLVQVPEVEVHVIKGWDRLKCQARFRYNGIQYWLTVTDPAIEAQFLPKGLSNNNLGPCLLTISLSASLPKKDDSTEYRFKLVAAIIPLR